MSIIGSVLIILACLAASAFFSGSETALLRLRSHDLDPDKEGFGPADVAVRDLTSSSSRLLVTILLGNNVVNILGASVASGLAISLLGAEAGIPVATAVMTALVLLFCEILPKAVAARHPRGVSRAVGLPLYLFHQILRPLHGLFDRAIEPLVRRVTGGVDGERSLGSEEVLRLAREALEEHVPEVARGRVGRLQGEDHRRVDGRRRGRRGRRCHGELGRLGPALELAADHPGHRVVEALDLVVLDLGLLVAAADPRVVGEEDVVPAGDLGGEAELGLGLGIDARAGDRVDRGPRRAVIEGGAGEAAGVGAGVARRVGDRRLHREDDILQSLHRRLPADGEGLCAPGQLGRRCLLRRSGPELTPRPP